MQLRLWLYSLFTKLKLVSCEKGLPPTSIAVGTTKHHFYSWKEALVSLETSGPLAQNIKRNTCPLSHYSESIGPRLSFAPLWNIFKKNANTPPMPLKMLGTCLRDLHEILLRRCILRPTRNATRCNNGADLLHLSFTLKILTFSDSYTYNPLKLWWGFYFENNTPLSIFTKKLLHRCSLGF